MTMRSKPMTDATQDPTRPHVTWFTSDPRDARLAELTTALRHIRTLASDAPSLAMNMTDGDIFDAIASLACDALAGAQPEPCAVAKEAMAI
jgi:hypothetical protein